MVEDIIKTAIVLPFHFGGTPEYRVYLPQVPSVRAVTSQTDYTETAQVIAVYSRRRVLDNGIEYTFSGVIVQHMPARNPLDNPCTCARDDTPARVVRQCLSCGGVIQQVITPAHKLNLQECGACSVSTRPPCPNCGHALTGNIDSTSRQTTCEVCHHTSRVS